MIWRGEDVFPRPGGSEAVREGPKRSGQLGSPLRRLWGPSWAVRRSTWVIRHLKGPRAAQGLAGAFLGMWKFPRILLDNPPRILYNSSMNNNEAYALARSIIARPSNAEAVAAYARCAKLSPQPGDAEKEQTLILAIVGELTAHLGDVTMPHTVVNECLWAAVN